MLQLLHEPQGAGRFTERASTVEHDLSSAERATEIAPAPLVLFDIQDAAMPPPSPASPQALASLSPPVCPPFGLDAPAMSCPICLEIIDDVADVYNAGKDAWTACENAGAGIVSGLFGW